MKKFIIAIIALAFLAACCPQHAHPRRAVTKTEHITQSYYHDTTNDVWFWLYIMNMNNSTYYISSSTPVSNFSSTPWTPSTLNTVTTPAGTRVPVETQNMKEVKELEEPVVETPDGRPESPEEMAVEAEQTEAATENTSTEESSSSESSSSESSSSSSDSGGGGGGE